MNDRQNLAEDTWGSHRMFQRDVSAVRRKKKVRCRRNTMVVYLGLFPMQNSWEFCMTFHRMLPNAYGELEVLG